MVMGRMVYNFTSTARLAGIKAWRFTLYFVLMDIVLVPPFCLVGVGGSLQVIEHFWPRLLALLQLRAMMYPVIRS